MFELGNRLKSLKLEREDKLFIIPMIISFFFHFYRLGYSEFAGDEASPLRFTITFLYGFVDPKFFGSFFLFHHPPLRILINVPMVMAFGTNEFVVRFLGAFLGFLSIFLIYKISEESFNKKTALLASFLYAVCGLSLINRLSMGVGPFVFFSLLAFYFTVKFYKATSERKEFLYLFIASISIALTVLFYLEAVLFLPGILYAVIKKKGFAIFKQKRFWKSVMIFPILLLLFIVPWVLIPHMVPGIDAVGSYGYMLQRVDDSSALNIFEGLSVLIAYNSVYFVALIFIGIVISLIFLIKKIEMKLIILYILFFYIFFTFLVSTPTIHHMHALPFLIIMASSGLIVVFDYLRNRAARYMFLAIILAVLVLSSLHVYSVLDGNEKTGIWHTPIKNGWKAAGYFIRENTDTMDYYFADEDGYKTRIYTGRRYYGDMNSFFDDIGTEEWSKVKYILLTRVDTPVWDYVNENYELSATIYVGNEPSLYIFGREEADSQTLHNEDYDGVFDQEYGNAYNMLPYLPEVYS